MADISLLEEAKVMDRFTAEGEMWWIVVGIDAATSNAPKPRIIVHAEGDTDLEGLKGCLRDDQLQYGCLKVLGVDTKGAVVSTRMKLVFFQWVGPKLSKIKGSKAIPTKAALSQFFQGAHLTLEVYDKAALSAEDIEARLRAAGGAHQPSDMKFGSGSSVKIMALPAEVDPDAPVAAPTPAPTPAPAPAAAYSTSTLKPAGGNMFAAVSDRSIASPKPAPAPAPVPVAAVVVPASIAPGTATVSRAKAEAQASVASLGKAAAALRDLMASGNTVSVAALAAFVEGPLGAAAVAGAATLALVSEL